MSNAARHCILFFTVSLMLFIALPVCSQPTDYNAMSRKELQEKIATLGLGFDDFIIGKALTEKQQKTAAVSEKLKAYPGTSKFKVGETFVISDEKSNVVIAVYRRNQAADRNDFKATVGELMLLYGEPTAEAHGKTIYWNYGPDGLITEELYRTAKSQGRLDTLQVLATIKFSSLQNMETVSAKTEDDKSAEKVSSDNYVMIQSDILSKKYMAK